MKRILDHCCEIVLRSLIYDYIIGHGRSIILISADKQKALAELVISLDTGFLMNAYSIEKEWKEGMKEGGEEEGKRGREERKRGREREREIGR